MADTTITSANSVVAFTAGTLFQQPQILSGYSADRAWQSDAVSFSEVQMGVDGRMTGGFTPNPISITFSLQADSPSKQFFLQIQKAILAQREIFYINGTIDLPSTGESFICTRGLIGNFKPLPDAAKVLQPMDFTITFEAISPTYN